MGENDNGTGLTVLSLFDGMGCGQIALRELGIKVDKYYASEVDRHAIAQVRLNFPGTVHLGNGWTVEVIKHIFSFIDVDKILKRKHLNTE